MGKLAIHVDQLGKVYRSGERRAPYNSLRDTIARFWTRSRIKNSAVRDTRLPKSNHVWALRDVSFRLGRGEVLGVIGRNGAGKSTLLKLLSRITEPSTGEIQIFGRVGALLEVGTGFHPELTGRENIHLSGAILGMKRSEINKKFEEIVVFAELDQFIDTPVKYYSSGMYMRLAFSVAAHLETEVLLIDEVLAVGDLAFQKKCLGRMSDVASGGRTVVFVSHDLGAISALTRTSLLLDCGRVLDLGPTPKVVRTYLDKSFGKETNALPGLDVFRRQNLDDPLIRITGIAVNGLSRHVPTISIGSDIRVAISAIVRGRVAGANITLIIKDVGGRRIATIFSWDSGFYLDGAKGQQTITLDIHGLPLSPGRYVADIGINQSTSTLAYDVILDYPLVNVVGHESVTHWLERPWGAVHWQEVTWTSSPGH